MNGRWHMQKYYDRRGDVVGQELDMGRSSRFFMTHDKAEDFPYWFGGENVAYSYGSEKL